MAPIAAWTGGVVLQVLENFLDIAGGVLYNPLAMDSLNVFLIPTEALSSLLFWNWWAVAAQ